MAFAKFMATWFGRGIRILAGLVLIAIGLFAVGDTAGLVLALVGVLPVLAGVFNVCLIAPIIGAPFSGRKALQS